MGAEIETITEGSLATSDDIALLVRQRLGGERPSLTPPPSYADEGFGPISRPPSTQRYSSTPTVVPEERRASLPPTHDLALWQEPQSRRPPQERVRKDSFRPSSSEIAHSSRGRRPTRATIERQSRIIWTAVGIGLALFGLMLRTIAWLILQIFKPTLDFRQVIAEVLFMLVMVEVVRLVISYLKEHRVAVDFMVELGIVATLREIVLRGVTDLAWQQLLALTMFVLALGALLRFGDLRSPYVPDREETLPQSGVKVSG